MSLALRAVVHNWRLKLAALGLSIFLWALVQTEPRNQETVASLPVTVSVDDTAWVVSGPPSPATVQVRVGGSGREIDLALEDAALRIPVSMVASSDTVIPLRRDFVSFAQSGVTVEAITPGEVRVSFERAQTRLVPVSKRIRGEVPAHLALASEITVTPQRVRVRGPESRVSGLDSVYLEPFDIGRIREGGIYSVALDTTGLGWAALLPPTAALSVRVEELMERILDGVPVLAEPEDGEAQVVADPLAIQVRLSGARTLVSGVDPAGLRVWIAPEALRGMAPGEERLVRLRVDGLPDLVTASPLTEVVTVRRTSDVGSGVDGRRPG